MSLHILVLLEKYFLYDPMPKSPPKIWPILFLNYSLIKSFYSLENGIVRENVEKIDSFRSFLPATLKQTLLAGVNVTPFII